MATPAGAQRGSEWDAFELQDLEAIQEKTAQPFCEFMRAPTLRAGLFVLPAGSEGDHIPHDEDMVCHVVSGGGVFQADGRDQPIGPGSIIYAKAGVDRLFHSIVEDLKLLVFFAAEPF
jgi:quercetin dioxygenase-like cupin family protein